MTERRIETTTSRTAEMTCLCRAASYLDTNPYFHSGDSVAQKLLPRQIQLAFKLAVVRKLILKAFAPEGVYEWVIARTKYIDDLFSRICSADFSQVLLIGGGFDTRVIRFQADLKGKNVFELDAPTTQDAKIEQYKARGVAIPPNLTFVPINFEKEAVVAKLGAAGFHRGLKTFVIVEGVMQYLAPEAAYAILKAVQEITGAGSWVVFDYAHAAVLRREGNAYGQERMLKGTEDYGESWQFGLDAAEVEPMLARYGFELIEQISPVDLEKMYFTDESEKLLGKVNGTQSIALARKV